MADLFAKVEGFEWDEGNLEKSSIKHWIEPKQSEEIFNNNPLIILDDEKHSATEQRYYALGRTNNGKLVTNIFTVRNNKIRIISSRSMGRKERKLYEKEA